MPQPNAVDLAVANLAQNAPATPSEVSAPVAEDFSYLNDPPGELDQLPPAPDAAVKAAPAGAPASPGTPAAPAAAAVPTHPAALIEAARSMGIRESVINSLGTEDLYTHTLDLQRRYAALETSDARRQQADESATKQFQQRIQQAEQGDSDDAILNALEQDGIDKRVVGLLRKRFKEVDEIKGNEQQRQQREQSNAQQRKQRAVNIMDAAIDGLGLDVLFGKGSMSGLAQGSEERDFRYKIATSAQIDLVNDDGDTIRAKIADAARPYRKLAAKFKASAETAQEQAANDTAAAYGQAPNGKVSPQRWDAAALAKPTATKPAKTRSEKAAAEAVRDYMQDHGVHVGQNNNEYEGVPD